MEWELERTLLKMKWERTSGMHCSLLAVWCLALHVGQLLFAPVGRGCQNFTLWRRCFPLGFHQSPRLVHNGLICLINSFIVLANDCECFCCFSRTWNCPFRVVVADSRANFFLVAIADLARGMVGQLISSCWRAGKCAKDWMSKHKRPGPTRRRYP